MKIPVSHNAALEAVELGRAEGGVVDDDFVDDAVEIGGNVTIFA